jgi:hypothetical protein
MWITADGVWTAIVIKFTTARKRMTDDTHEIWLAPTVRREQSLGLLASACGYCARIVRDSETKKDLWRLPEVFFITSLRKCLFAA